MKLLFAEDEYYTRTGILSSVDWSSLGVDTVLSAENGNQALELLGAGPDILLTDIRMPFCSGIELATEAQRRNSACEVIILSSYSDKEYLKAAISLSAVAYLEKPVKLEELQEAIVGAVQRSRRAERLRALERQEKGREEAGQPAFSKNADTVISYIREHFSDPDLNLETLAGVVHLTPDYLSASFKEETGKNLKRYLTDVRIAEARRLLLETNEPVTEIALRTGYSSNHYFAKTFRRETGYTPSEYRETGITEESP